MIIKTIKHLRVQCDAHLSLLRARWKKTEDAGNCRDAYTQLLSLAEQQATRWLLVELDEQPDISVYDQLWASEHFIPRLLQLPLQRLVVSIPSERVYNQQVLETLLDTAPPQLAHCDVQFFTQAQAGLHWLTNDASRLPEVQAEWAQANPDAASVQELAGKI